MTMLGLGCREEAGTRDCQSNDVRRIMQSYVVESWSMYKWHESPAKHEVFEKKKRKGKGEEKRVGGKMEESFRETEEGLLAEGCRNERKSPKNKDYWTRWWSVRRKMEEVGPGLLRSGVNKERRQRRWRKRGRRSQLVEREA
jgi:hypothetical protein